MMTLSGRQGRRGFALLIAVIFMSVMLTFGLALGSLGYKQQILASSVTASQYAFYAADAALECALYADQQQNLFAYDDYDPGAPDPKTVTCGGYVASVSQPAPSPEHLISRMRIHLDSDTRCADITVYKPPPDAGTTYIFSQGYDISCTTVGNQSATRFVSRGIHIHY